LAIGDRQSAIARIGNRESGIGNRRVADSNEAAIPAIRRVERLPIAPIPIPDGRLSILAIADSRFPIANDNRSTIPPLSGR
jgi:hypothetical protein